LSSATRVANGQADAAVLFVGQVSSANGWLL
jgi:hypothetical protein